eukprot:g958.t1
MSFFKKKKSKEFLAIEKTIKGAVTSDCLSEKEGKMLLKLAKKDWKKCLAQLEEKFIWVPTLKMLTANNYSAGKEGAFWKRWGIIDSSKTLGEGRSHVQVYAGVDRSDVKKKVAIKCCQKANFSTECNDRAEITKCCSMMHRIDKSRRKNLAEFFDWNEDEHNLYLVYDLIEGEDLFSAIVDRADSGNKWTEAEARDVMKEFVTGLKVLHDADMYHRDLKPENLMVSKVENHIKLIDFGTVALSNSPSLTSTGSALYSPVEQLGCGKAGKEWLASQGVKSRELPAYLPRQADIFSVGTILYPLLSGMLPFENLPQWVQYEIDLDLPEWNDISEDAKDLIRLCCHKDPMERPTCAEILSHPWFQRSDGDKHLHGAIKGLAKIVEMRTKVKVKQWQWKVMNLKSFHDKCEANIYVVDHNKFAEKYQISSGTIPNGECDRTRKKAIELGMRQYHSVPNLRDFILIGQKQMDILKKEFPEGLATVSGHGKDRKVKIPSGSPSKQFAIHTFLLKNKDDFPIVQAIKNDVYAVQQTVGTPTEVITFANESGNPEEFVFESPWKSATGEYELCFVAVGDYLCITNTATEKEVYRIEHHEFEVNYRSVDSALQNIGDKRAKILELKKRYKELLEKRTDLESQLRKIDNEANALDQQIKLIIE